VKYHATIRNLTSVAGCAIDQSLFPVIFSTQGSDRQDTRCTTDGYRFNAPSISHFVFHMEKLSESKWKTWPVDYQGMAAEQHCSINNEQRRGFGRQAQQSLCSWFRK
jgi:hypothetical protein